MTGDAYVATSPPSTMNWAMWDVVRDPWAPAGGGETSSVVSDDPWASLPEVEPSSLGPSTVEKQLDQLLL